MKSSVVVPVIMCGGSGTRLWPVSRKQSPKQFVPMIGESSLFDLTLLRASAISDSGKMICIANQAYKHQIENALARKNLNADIVLEPMARNTAAALGSAALVSSERDPGSVLVCLPSDHVCPDSAAFAASIDIAAQHARAGMWMTLGVTPRFVTSAYGYILPGEVLPGDGLAVRVRQFAEKPDANMAEMIIADGGLWNAGVFVVTAENLIDALEEHAPDILKSCRTALSQAERDGDTVHLNEDAFAACRAESIDYAVLENHENAGMVPLDAEWSDAGSWNSVSALTEPDASGNRLDGDIQVFGGKNNYVRSPHKLSVVLGVEDLVVVDTPDALLVTTKGASEDLKTAIASLETQEREELENHRLVTRPWGTFESLERGEGYQVKRLTVTPGSVLSLQYHHHRSEHWVVVRGTALVTRDEQEFELKKNESTYIPQGAVHRLKNPGEDILEIIEVQLGSYLGEDDIVRLEDQYGRAKEPSQ